MMLSVASAVSTLGLPCFFHLLWLHCLVVCRSYAQLSISGSCSKGNALLQRGSMVQNASSRNRGSDTRSGLNDALHVEALMLHDFVAVDEGVGHACQRPRILKGLEMDYLLSPASTRKLEECKSSCRLKAGCQAIEFVTNSGRCKVWTRPESLGSMEGATRHICLNYTGNAVTNTISSNPEVSVSETLPTSSATAPVALVLAAIVQHAEALPRPLWILLLALSIVAALYCLVVMLVTSERNARPSLVSREGSGHLRRQYGRRSSSF
eukprot:TRINITY_DN61507_c0_g1_i1.p1 TRINITY_DN61507_c0_g1~~TRINITY_DN61507_c0_g1_i1.p1  ORF type:complete len:266 (-),score=31.52 TRINITY_DN61507_c0_g1_i1:352-1149(-)